MTTRRSIASVVLAAASMVALLAAGQQSRLDDLRVLSITARPGSGDRMLSPPAQVRAFLPGTTGNVDATASAIRLQSDWPASRIASHYSSQIVSAGWRASSPTIDRQGISIARFAGRARTGDAATAVLTVLDLEPSIRVVQLQIVRDRSAVSAAARGPAPEPLPRLSPRGGAGASGATSAAGLPAGFPRELLLNGAQVRAVTQGPGTTFVRAVISGLEAGVYARFSFGLARSGWIFQRPPTRGFVSSWPALDFCRDHTFAVLEFTPAAAGTLEQSARVAVRPTVSCEPVRGYTTPFADVPLVLVKPAGALDRGAGAGGGLQSFHANTRLTTDMPLAAIAAHYADQLSGAGWAVDPSIGDSALAAHRFNITTNAGERIVGVLVLTALPGKTIDASLAVHRPQRPVAR